MLLLLTTTTTGCILLNIPLFIVQYGILAFPNKCPDCTGLHLRVLEFSEFSGRACPQTPGMSNFGLSLWAPMHPYCISPQYAPLRLTNKKCLGTPLTSIINKNLFLADSIFTLYHLMFSNFYQAFN